MKKNRVNLARAGVGQLLNNEQPEEFIQRLMVAKCNQGSMDFQYLNLPEDHGVYFTDTDHPMMNACDYKADRHVLQFGRCKSEGNPKNMLSEGINKLASSPLAALVPGAAVLALANKAKEAMGCEGCKCSPKTLKVWENTDEGNCLDGANGILNTSTLVCCYGGIITITEEPQPEEKDEDASQETTEEQGEEAPTKKTVAERMPTAMAEKLQSLNGEDYTYTDTSSTNNGMADGQKVGKASPMAGKAAQKAGKAAPMARTAGGLAMMGAIDTRAMLEDMQNWYQKSEDFEQSYGVTGAMMLSNYANNICQDIPMTALNEEGYICDGSELTAFRMGGSSAALIGTGCVSAFNAFQALGEPQEFGDIIMAAEAQQTVPGFMDQGPMAVSMLSTCSMLDSMGFHAKAVRPDFILDAREPFLEEEAVAIIGTAKKSGRTEFHTLKRERSGKICCMEDKACEVESLISKGRKEPQMMVKVSRKGKGTAWAKEEAQSGISGRK